MFLSFFKVSVFSYVDLFWYLVQRPSVPLAGKPTTKKEPLRPSETQTKIPPTKPSTTLPPIKPPTTVTIPIPDKGNKSFFALIIGINNYSDASVPLLSGCVADAEAMRHFLTATLKVPDSQIRFLSDTNAKRADIIKAFLELQTDPRIKKNDPVLIFFAGHGAETKTPAGWHSGDVDNKIQMIIPQDYSTKRTKQVHGIPDRTLGALINGIARAKGDNITVILDCCHSGSGTRKGSADEITVRGMTIAESPPSDIDHDLLTAEPATRGSSTAAGFARKGLESHVLLAACTQKEQAREQSGRGNFTKAILQTIEAIGADKLTYASLLERMDKIPAQNPQCEGVNQKRILFDSKAPPPHRVCFPIAMKGSRYELQAGSAQGVTKGAEFTVYKDSASISDPNSLGVLIVQADFDIHVFSTFLTPKTPNAVIPLSKSSCALQSKAGEAEDLVILAPLDEKLLSLYEAIAKEMKEADPARRKIRFVKDGKEAKLGLSLNSSGRVAFDILDSRLTIYGINRMPHTVENKVKSIMPVLNAAAHFHWYLSREKKDALVDTSISFEIFKLSMGDEYDFSGNAILEPVGENLYQDSVIRLVSSEEDMYGFKVTNNSVRDLYLNAFYFDNSDFSISSCYQSPTSGQFKSYPTLPQKGGFVTVGYGSGGVSPFAYTLEDGVDIDVGFLMLFITSNNIDLSMIPQESPFIEGRKQTQVAPTQTPIYGTILIPIVQRR